MTDCTPTADAPSAPQGLGIVTGTLLIVANMIGVGVFTTTGYMVSAIPSPPAVLLAWLCGGLAALCGALSYAELGSALPRNGGEYRLLSRIYHPAIGFAAGWVSLIVGFAAPLASFALAFGSYLQAVVPEVAPVPAGLCLILFCAVLHSLHVSWGNRFHNTLTLGKIGLIVVFIVVGLIWGDPARLSVESDRSVAQLLASPNFAVQLVYVSFAYAGWNTAAYLAGEFRHPERDILRSVLIGTVLVSLLYLALNAVFLAAAPMSELAGQDRVGHVAATHLLGKSGGSVMSLLIVIGLVSTVSANLIAGPRVYEAVGIDFPRLGFLGIRRAGGGPVVAIALQAAIAATMVLVSSLQGLLTYIGVTLSLCAAATVLGVYVLRWREPELNRPYRTWGYPLTPLVFLAVEGWMIVFALRQNPLTGVCGTVTIATGLFLYWLVRERPSQPAD